eukprot:tig00000178_g12721.t1
MLSTPSEENPLAIALHSAPEHAQSGPPRSRLVNAFVGADETPPVPGPRPDARAHAQLSAPVAASGTATLEPAEPAAHSGKDRPQRTDRTNSNAHTPGHARRARIQDEGKRKAPSRSLAARWRDLSMKKKLMALVASTQLLTTLVLIGVVVLVLFLSMHSQLNRQAVSEILTNQIVYDIKNNQMSYGFAGQGDNPSIISAARLGPTATGPEAEAILRSAKAALVNEIVRRDIEYSSLLSADADPLVIVSSNRDRRGEPMPELRSFTRALIESNKPTRFSLLVSRKELVEGEGAVPKDPTADYFLVRFVGHPVYTGPDQSRPAAILLAGDVVNGKNWTVEPSRAAFKSGYVAVYQRSRPDCASSEPGCFRVSTAMLPEDTEPRLAPLLGAAADSLLDAASSAQPPGSVVTNVLILAGHHGREEVTVAVKALQDPTGRSIAFLVRATSHVDSDGVLRTGVVAGVASGVVTCAVSCWLSWLLIEAVEEFDFHHDNSSSSSTHSFTLPPGKAFTLTTAASDEIGRLTTAFSRMTRRVTDSYMRLEEAKERATFEEARQKLIFDTCNDAVFVTDSACNVLSMNPRAAAMFLYDPSEVVGHNVKILQPPNIAAIHDDVVARHVAAGLTLSNHQLFRDTYGKRKNGELFPIQIGLSEMKIGDEHLFVGMIRDITERKEMEKQITRERTRTEKLLKNLLPPTIADRLKDMQEAQQAARARSFKARRRTGASTRRMSITQASEPTLPPEDAEKDDLFGTNADLIKGALADRVDNVPVLFADIVNFTPLASSMDPARLVSLLNDIFYDFDSLAEKFGLEKIKTIGDAFMCAGGVPPDVDAADLDGMSSGAGEVRRDSMTTQRRSETFTNSLRSINGAKMSSFIAAEAQLAAVRAEPPVVRMARLALAMHEAISRYKSFDGRSFRIRIGIHCGTVIAGVIGKKKLLYDLWGDTVNVASRMESSGVPGRTQVTEETYYHLRSKFALEERGRIHVKGIGEMRTYFLQGAKPSDPEHSHGLGQLITTRSDHESHRPQGQASLRKLAAQLRFDPRIISPEFSSLAWPKTDLAAVMLGMTRLLGLIDALRIDEGDFVAFVNVALSTYRDKNSFHNVHHAIDVAQCMFIFLLGLKQRTQPAAIAAEAALDPDVDAGGGGAAAAPVAFGGEPAVPSNSVAFDDVETFALLVAGLCHDLDHPGVTNAFLAKSHAPMAILYSNSSPLERHHAATLLSLLQRKDVHILANMSRADQERFSQLAVDAVLATDMVLHNDFLVSLARRFPACKGVSGIPAAAPGSSPCSRFSHYSEKALLGGLLLKCADLANGARTFEHSKISATQIQQEFFEQSTLEAEMALEPTPGFSPTNEPDRGNASRQVGFLTAVVQPLYETLAAVAPELPVARAMAANVRSNAEQWGLLRAQHSVHGGSSMTMQQA